MDMMDRMMDKLTLLSLGIYRKVYMPMPTGSTETHCKSSALHTFLTAATTSEPKFQISVLNLNIYYLTI